MNQRTIKTTQRAVLSLILAVAVLPSCSEESERAGSGAAPGGAETTPVSTEVIESRTAAGGSAGRASTDTVSGGTLARSDAGGTGGSAGAATAGRGGDRADVDQSVDRDGGVGSETELLVPKISADYRRVYVPADDRYLNDHTVVKDGDGIWHVFGIANTGVGSPQQERTFLHATAGSLLGEWTDQPDALTASDSANERILWSPHVVRVDEHWTMFYYSAPLRPEDPVRNIRRAESTDMRQWTRAEQEPNPSERSPGGRDPYLFRQGDHWLLYSVGARKEHGQILVTRNDGADLSQGWSQTQMVIEDPVTSYSWGNLESPFVVRLAGYYYLFLTRTGEDSQDSYTRTLVFRSENPENFAWEPVAQLYAHAAEIIQDGSQWFISSAGWPSEIGAQNRGLSIAPLSWAEE